MSKRVYRVGGMGTGRVAVTPEDPATFSREIAGGSPDVWQGSDRIINELMKPHQDR